MLVCLALVACNQNTNKDPKDTSSSVTTTVRDTSKDTQKDSKNSWFTHSVVVVKLKDGVDVKTVAEKIIGKTDAVRFGCLRPQAIVGAYTGSFVVFTTSDKDKCDAVFEAVKTDCSERENTALYLGCESLKILRREWPFGRSRWFRYRPIHKFMIYYSKTHLTFP